MVQKMLYVLSSSYRYTKNWAVHNGIKHVRHINRIEDLYGREGITWVELRCTIHPDYPKRCAYCSLRREVNEIADSLGFTKLNSEEDFKQWKEQTNES